MGAGMTTVMGAGVTAIVGAGMIAGMNVEFLLFLTRWIFSLPKMFWFRCLNKVREGKVALGLWK